MAMTVEAGWILFPGRGGDWKARAHQAHLAWLPAQRCWGAPATPRAAAAVLQLVPANEILGRARDELHRLAEQHLQLEQLLVDLQRARTESELLDLLCQGLDWGPVKPYRHQRHAILHLLAFPRWGLWLGTGTGKTLIALIAFRLLQQLGEVRRLFVVCPLGLRWETWHASAVRIGLTAAVLEGTKFEKLLRFRSCTADVVITNYESLRASGKEGEEHDFGEEYAAEIARGSWMVALDEAYRIGSDRAKQSQACRQISWAAKRSVAMTASLLSGDLRRLWEICKTLDRGETFGPAWGRFMEIAERGGAAQNFWGVTLWETSPAFVAYVQQQTARIGTTWELQDCVDLPARIIRDLRVTMTDRQRMVEEAYRKDIAQIVAGERLIYGEEPIVRLTRRAQATSGFYLTEKHEIRYLDPNPKLDTLAELFEGELRGVKTIVWCRYLEEIDLVAKRLDLLRVSWVEYSGRTMQVKKSAALAQYTENRDPQVFLATPGAGGEGLTLNAAEAMVYYGIGYDFVQYEQALGRNYRIGQTRKVVVYRLICKASVDIDILANLDKHKRLKDLIR